MYFFVKFGISLKVRLFGTPPNATFCKPLIGKKFLRSTLLLLSLLPLLLSKINEAKTLIV